MSLSPAALLALICPALLLAAAVRDATSYTIPNAIPLALALLFPVAALANGVALGGLAAHVGVGAAALCVGLTLFALRAIGGGDAKLFAATALWIGWPIAPFVMFTVLAGGGLAALLLALRVEAFRSLMNSGPAWVARLARPGQGAPYGVAIAVGALMVLPQTPFGLSLGV